MFDPALVTVGDFKTQFYRGFNYLPVWLDTVTYQIGDLVFYAVTQRFYICKTADTTSDPTTTADWTLTTSVVKTDYVWDEDITNAYAEAITVFSRRFSAPDDQLKLMYLYLSAHYLVLDLRAQGTQSQTQGLVRDRAVGNVSEGYEIPKWMTKQGLSFYISTYYGYKYLNLTYPYRVGNVQPIRGNGPYTYPVGCRYWN